MKKTFKKIISSVMAVTTFAVGMVGMNVNAYSYASCKEMDEVTEEAITSVESKPFNPGTYESSEERYKRYINSDYATPEKIAAYEQMMKEHEEILNGNYVTPRASFKKLGVPFYEQQNGYYCGPATVRQVYAYLKNTNNPPAQSTIAKAMGTTSNGTENQAIIDYLNSKCSVTYEALWKGGAYKSASKLFNLVMNDISNNKPTIAHIKDTNTSNWKYSVSGHYLCFEGYLDDTTTNGHVIDVVDPWLNGHKISTGKYIVTVDKAFAVTDRICS